MKTLEELVKTSRDLANELFQTETVSCIVSGGTRCLEAEEGRALTKPERDLGWTRRPFSAYDPNRLCSSCRAYFYAELAAQTLHDLRCLKIKQEAWERAAAAGKEVATEPPPKLPKVKFRDWECDILVQNYQNGRIALQLVDAGDGEPVATATVNLSDEHPEMGCVFIKNYSENEGMLAALEAAGLVKATGRIVQSGYVSIPEAKLLLPVTSGGLA